MAARGLVNGTHEVGGIQFSGSPLPNIYECAADCSTSISVG